MVKMREIKAAGLKPECGWYRGNHNEIRPCQYRQGLFFVLIQKRFSAGRQLLTGIKTAKT
ncbi:hypothetical protein DDV21_003255 [Streptococcus chenjunshii]|uniref:Uncharacterized protein n=1 Tax=Streptococcus chenjunshii TaxID=2173853 RepID=A0A372KNH6_9STRE|nr:hypothetical protein DDV21_003255 [Streptococcus chenjunshii]RFU50692.1 hypothetical protein DDV22_07335 [Streptococcus chenjunshii]RFU53464.1 hypothetical protein DDV23_04515 [Streptococcus chenjunshii]